MSQPSEHLLSLPHTAHASLLSLATVVWLSAVPCINAQPLTITRFAGANRGPGWFDGTGSAARFRGAAGVAVDSAGNVYVADTGNHTIRKISLATGEVTTLAGLAGASGSADGRGSAARFQGPYGIAVDASGTVYVADSGNHIVRTITPAGVVSTLAGSSGSLGSVDGTGSEARFHDPRGLALDASGNIYVADYLNLTIRKVTPIGAVSTLAGLAGASGATDGTGSEARFRGPLGVAVNSLGDVYVVDNNHTIRKVTPSGVVSTVAGLADFSGSEDGPGSAARFSFARGATVDRSDNLYVADSGNHAVRKVTPDGVVSTFAGLAGFMNSGSVDGAGSAVRFYWPMGVAVDTSGSVYVADSGNQTIRAISDSGVVSTVAGAPGHGSEDGTRSEALFAGPEGVARDRLGNVYVSDDDTVRKITPSGDVSTLAGLAGVSGSADGMGTDARFDHASSVAVDGSGNVFVADTFNDTIRKINPAGVVSTLAGFAGLGSSGWVDGAGPAARFFMPQGVAVDGMGNVFVADWGNSAIRKVTPAGVVSTLAGLGGYPNQGHADGIGPAARFWNPRGVAVDSSGNVFVADTANNTIRKVTPGGVVSTLAGLAGYGNSGSTDGTGSTARFHWPIGVAVDPSGSLYVTDSENHTIRKINPSGVVSTVAGLPGPPGFEDGIGPAARFTNPTGIAMDGAGDLFVADSGNLCIRKGTVGAGFADAPTIDRSTGYTGQIRQLDTTPQQATTRLWQEVRRPSGSTATLSSTTIRNPTFTPDVPDLYVFQLTATDDSGLQSITTVSLTATEPPESVRADFTWAATPVAGQPIQFTDASTGSPTSWSWDLGDGYSSTAQNPTHSFATAGTFPVTLTASNAGGSNSTTKTVTVAPAGASSCVEDAATMCLAGGRYRVRSHWRNQYAAGAVSTLSKAKLTDLTGAFWLTNADTYEYLIRINTATDNGAAWIAIPTFTDVEFWIDVTDTVSGQSKAYHSAPGNKTLIYDPFFFVYP